MEGWEEIAASERRSPVGSLTQLRSLSRVDALRKPDGRPHRRRIPKRPFDWQEERMPIRKEMQQRYPKDWALRSRFVRFYRAGNRCEWCGVHNYSLREDTGAEEHPPQQRCCTF